MADAEPICCVTCGKVDDGQSLSPLQCQLCWEDQCAQSWWEMVSTMNALNPTE